MDRIMHREAKKAGRYDEKGRLKFIPEDRMKESELPENSKTRRDRPLKLC